MTKIIHVADFTKSGFTQEDAEVVSAVLEKELAQMSNADVLCFDFSGVKYFTTLFFNVAFTSLLRNMSIDAYECKISLVNLSDVGQTAYSHSLENAKRFAAMPKNERDEREKIIDEILKEVQGE